LAEQAAQEREEFIKILKEQKDSIAKDDKIEKAKFDAFKDN
jgi:hypothetical protein